MKKLYLLVLISIFLVSCGEKNSPTARSGEENGFEWIDLGLPSGIKWASINVGANSKYEIGNYYAWGEVEPKDEYRVDNYKWGQDYNWTKYNREDKKLVLDLEDDASHVNWGGKWRTATDEEWEELHANTTQEWFQKNGKEGVIFTSVKNGQSIYFPATGHPYMKEEYNPEKQEMTYVPSISNPSIGYYWTRSKPKAWWSYANPSENGGSISVMLTEYGAAYNSYDMHPSYSSTGMCVRPVMK